MTGEHVDGVVMQDGDSGTDGDGCDEAVDEAPKGVAFPATAAKQGGRLVVVCGCRRKHGRTESWGHRGTDSRWCSSLARMRIASQVAISPSSRASTRSQIGDPVLAETPPMPRCRSGSRIASGSQLIEVAIPAGPAHPPRLFDAEGLRRQRSECEVDRRALRSQGVPAHDFRARRLIDIDVGAGHAHTIHHRRAFRLDARLPAYKPK